MKENSWKALKLQNKLDRRWPSDLLNSKKWEKEKDNSRLHKLWIENSKWKLMNLEKKKLSSWLPDATSKEKSNLWIRDLSLKTKLLRNKYMPNCGCLMLIRKLNVSKEKLCRWDIKFKKPSISWLGKQIRELNKLILINTREWKNNKCLKTNGLKKRIWTKKLKDNNLFLTEKETLSLSSITPPKENLEMFNLKLKNIEIKNFWIQL